MDCGPGGAECSFVSSNATRQCTCTDGNADTCVSLGTCVVTPCSKCRSCVTRVIPFTRGSLADSNETVVAKWLPFCTTDLSLDQVLCNNTQELIMQSAKGNLGRRAGALCALLQQCPPPEMLPNCTVSFDVSDTAVISGNLSLCTVEGITGNGTMLLNTVLTPPAMMNMSCKATADCRDPNLMCVVPAAVNETCVCMAGKDDCFRLGTCTPTPAKLCSDCLREWTAFGAANINSTNATLLSEAFLANCTRTRPSAACTPAAQAITLAPSFGKRAAGICTMLPDCSPAALSNTTMLSIPGLMAGSVLQGSPLDFDFCTVEGFSGGRLLPDFIPANSLPREACSVDSNCTGMGAGLFCNRTTTRRYCTCLNGTDTCMDLGQCQPTPCTRCQTCLQAVLSQFVAANLYQPKEVLVANFNTTCTLMQQEKNNTCKVVVGNINGSVPNGVLGRRAGGLCRALGACDPAVLSDCTMTVTSPDQKNSTGALSLCTVQGVAGGVRDGISASSGE